MTKIVKIIRYAFSEERYDLQKLVQEISTTDWYGEDFNLKDKKRIGQL